MNTHKTCTKCGETKPTSQFHKDASGKDGLRSQCKTCRLYAKAVYRAAHKEQIAVSGLAYRAGHKRQEADRQAAWARENPDKTRAKAHRHQAKKLGAEGNYTAADIERIRDAQGGRCCYCGAETKLTVDHILPLSRGGTNWPDNIALACLSCNSSKCDKLLDEWKPPF